MALLTTYNNANKVWIEYPRTTTRVFPVLSSNLQPQMATQVSVYQKFKHTGMDRNTAIVCATAYQDALNPIPAPPGVVNSVSTSSARDGNMWEVTIEHNQTTLTVTDVV